MPAIDYVRELPDQHRNRQVSVHRLRFVDDMKCKACFGMGILASLAPRSVVVQAAGADPFPREQPLGDILLGGYSSALIESNVLARGSPTRIGGEQTARTSPLSADAMMRNSHCNERLRNLGERILAFTQLSAS